MSEFTKIVNAYNRYCNYRTENNLPCSECKFYHLNNEGHAGCVSYLNTYPEQAEEFLAHWAANNPDPKDCCCMCGKELDDFDKANDFQINHHFGYGSRYDLHQIHARFCNDCCDKLIDSFINKCKINPMTEYDIEGVIANGKQDERASWCS